MKEPFNTNNVLHFDRINNIEPVAVSGEDEPASQEFIIRALTYHFEWSAKYLRAARRGDLTRMAQLDREWNPESLLEAQKEGLTS